MVAGASCGSALVAAGFDSILFDFGWPSGRLNHGSVLHLNIELPDCISASTASNGVPQQGV